MTDRETFIIIQKLKGGRFANQSTAKEKGMEKRERKPFNQGTVLSFTQVYICTLMKLSF